MLLTFKTYDVYHFCHYLNCLIDKYALNDCNPLKPVKACLMNQRTARFINIQHELDKKARSLVSRCSVTDVSNK
jgi:hypothetical protein